MVIFLFSFLGLLVVSFNILKSRIVLSLDFILMMCLKVNNLLCIKLVLRKLFYIEIKLLLMKLL